MVQVGKISVFCYLFGLMVVTWKKKKITGFPWPVFDPSKTRKTDLFFFSWILQKGKKNCVWKLYCSTSASFICRRHVLKQCDVKQMDKLSGFEGFESVVFESHGSYCCTLSSNWCSQSSLNFVPLVIQLMFPIAFSSACLWFMWSKWLLILGNSLEQALKSTGESVRAFFSLRWEVYRASHTCWFFPYFPQSITSFFLKCSLGHTKVMLFKTV